MKRFLFFISLLLAPTLYAGDMFKSVYDQDSDGVADSAETVPDSAITISKLYQDAAAFSDTSVPYLMVVYSTSTGKFLGLKPLTTFYATMDFGTPDFSAISGNNYDTTASTDPTYGKMRFIDGTSATTNCGYYVGLAPNDWNTNLDPTLNQFAVMIGSATDNGKQEYLVSVSSIPDNGSVTTATYTDPLTIDLATSSGANAFNVRAATSTYTLGNWKDNIIPGMPFAVRVCRDGNDGTNDTSGIDSYMLAWQMRYAHTTPGE